MASVPRRTGIFLVALVLASATANAQQRLRLHPVTISSDTLGTHFAVELHDSRRVLGHCTDTCWVYLPEGRYRVEVRESDTMLGGSRSFKLDAPTNIWLRPHAPVARMVWLGVACVSMLAIVAGGVWAAANANQYRDYRSPLGIALGGLFMTPISWIQFGLTYRPGITIRKQ